MTPRLHLSARHRALLESILRDHVHGVEVWAYGSRVNGRSHDGSDLDLVLRGPGLEEIPLERLMDFEDAVRESNIPFLVEARDWARLPERFQREIEREYVVLAEETGGASRWRSINLGRVCTKIGSGATPRGGKDVYLSNGPYALIRSQNILNNGFRHAGLAYIRERHASDLAGVEVRDKDVLLNITGDSVARVCQVDSRILPARVNQHVAIIRPDPTKLDPGFLRYFLACPQTQAKLLSWAGSGGTRNALTKAMIEAFDVRAPADVSEQRAIAHILGTLDDKIELNRRMNETLEAMARALFKSWFVDFDPVRAKMEGRDTGLPREVADLFPDRFVDSEMGEIPKGWKVFRLNQLAIHHTESTSPYRFPETEYEHFSIPAYDAGPSPAIEMGGSIRSNKTVVKENAVLLSKLNPAIARVWVPSSADSERPQVCSTEFLVFTPRPPANMSLLFALFADERFRSLLRSFVTGTSKSHQRVPPKALKAQDVLAGSLRAFAVFGETTGGVLSRVLRNRSESRTLAFLRDTLLPKLVSGQLSASEVAL